MRTLLGHDAVVTVTRVMAGLVGFILLAQGSAILVMPEVISTATLSLSTTGAGINSLRGDLGGLFLGMSLFCLLGASTRYRWLLLIPIAFLVFVVFGRSISILVDSFPTTMVGGLVAEIVFVLVLSLAVVSHALSSKSEPRPPALDALLHPRVLTTAGFVVLLLAGALSIRPRIGSGLWNGAIAATISRDGVEDLPDGLHVGLAGTGAPMPDSKRVGQSTFVLAGDHLFIVDSGPGSTLNLELMRVPLEETEAVLLTHFHSDHIAGLGELMLKSWTNGARTEPLRVMGPAGVEGVVDGFNQAFRLDARYRHAHHGDAVAPSQGAGGRPEAIEGFGEDGSVVIFREDGVTVTAFLVDHRPVAPAVGYRFDYRGRSVVVSGDTLPSECLMAQADGVDLLLHEAMDPDMLSALNRAATAAGEDVAAAVSNDILTYHTFPEEAARIARDANVGHLVLTHIIPPMPASILDAAFLRDARRVFQGPITLASDGMLFSLLPGTNGIDRRWLLR